MTIKITYSTFMRYSRTICRSLFGASYTICMSPITYTPYIEPTSWKRIEPFVSQLIDTRCDGMNEQWRYAHTHALTYFADWIFSTRMMALDDSLRGDVIEIYAAERAREISPSVAGRERNMLRTLAGLLNAAPPGQVIGSSTPSAPYAPADLSELHSWAMHQRTDYLRRACLAIFTLCLGCGLRAGEALKLRGRDIITLADGISLAVHVNGRTVPVIARWNDELAALKSLVPGADLAIAPHAKHRKDALAAILSSTKTLQPNPQRLRATWLISHVNAGTPLPTLLAAAGLTSLESIRRIFQYTTALPNAQAMDALRLQGDSA